MLAKQSTIVNTALVDSICLFIPCTCPGVVELQLTGTRNITLGCSGLMLLLVHLEQWAAPQQLVRLFCTNTVINNPYQVQPWGFKLQLLRKLCYCDVTSTSKALNAEVPTCVRTNAPVVCCQRGCTGLISSDEDSRTCAERCLLCQSRENVSLMALSAALVTI